MILPKEIYEDLIHKHRNLSRKWKKETKNAITLLSTTDRVVLANKNSIELRW